MHMVKQPWWIHPRDLNPFEQPASSAHLVDHFTDNMIHKHRLHPRISELAHRVLPADDMMIEAIEDD